MDKFVYDNNTNTLDINLFEKPINFQDKLEFDKSNGHSDKSPIGIYHGHVKVVDDESGETVLEKDNLITLRGRTFALEKMFNKTNEMDGYNKTDIASKVICLWQAGRGGCVEGEPFTTLDIDANCTELGEAVPFVATRDEADRPEGYYKAETSAIQDNNGVGYTYYYAKTFDNMEWVTNPDEYGKKDEIALKLTLTITEDDFKTVIDYDENGNTMFKRNTFINEIGLCIANPVKTTSVDRMDNIELATRLNFESEPYFRNIKSCHIYYYIYA